jgi:hypothetical protein
MSKPPFHDRLMFLRLTTMVSLTAAATIGQSKATHWAFVRPQKHLPENVDSSWCRDEIDQFVLAGLRKQGLQPSPAADRALLLRRVSLVLTGLPPEPASVTQFLADQSPDAYERKVDELLHSDAYAEHLATPWLDLARFADTYGYQSDFECRTWPWRDWLIRSFAADKPWDQFVREIVAGDELPEPTTETRTATAFWRLHRQTNEGGSIDEEWRHEYIADRVDTFGTAFLGLTIGCARCHDHKFDPITQRDYYAIGGFFAIDEAGLYPYSTGATPRPAMRLTTDGEEGTLFQMRIGAADADHAYNQAIWSAPAHPDSTIAMPVPIAQFRFDSLAEGKCTDERDAKRTASVPADLHLVAAGDGSAVECDGDARIAVPGLPAFSRDDDFSLRLRLWCPDRKERAVVLHTSHYTEDADTQGYQLLIKDGHLCWEIAHLWPGSAIAVRMDKELPLQKWCDVTVTYDGSSRANGMKIFVDGDRMATDTIRDHLDGPATVRTLELGARDRDRGFTGGRIDDFCVYDRCLSEAEVAVQSGRRPLLVQLAAHFATLDPAAVRAKAELRSARQALHAYEETFPELMVMADHPYPPERYVLRRGAYDQPDRQHPVPPGAPAGIPPLAGAMPQNRLGLAAWLNSKENPLSARVVVDRLWSQCFGRGLVGTPENFGRLGEPPTQPELLDALACDFQAEPSLRAMLRRIVTSATFRQSSTATAAQRDADPANVHLARGPSFRLSAEVLRDQALAASGLLHQQVGGPSVRPWQPEGLWRDSGVGWGGADYKPDTGPNAHRRSLYTYRKRTAPPPNMTVLDAPSRESCSTRRQNTDTPLQALTFWNDQVFTECATALAERTLNAMPTATDDERIRHVFACLAVRQPRAEELAALRSLHASSNDPKQALFLVASTLMASDAVVVLR